MKVNKQKLEIAMAEKTMNFSQLSILSKVSRPTLSYINNGKSCRADVVAKISNALGVGVTDIIELEENN